MTQDPKILKAFEMLAIAINEYAHEREHLLPQMYPIAQMDGQLGRVLVATADGAIREFALQWCRHHGNHCLQVAYADLVRTPPNDSPLDPTDPDPIGH